MIMLMAWSVLFTTLLGIACHYLEKCLSGFGKPSRIVWIVGVAFAVSVPLLSIFQVKPTRAQLVVDRQAATPSVSQPLISTVIPVGKSRLEELNPILVWLWLAASSLSVVTVGALSMRVRQMARRATRDKMAGFPVLVTADVGPALVGMFHYEIVVPRWTLSLSPEKQYLILAHEREHARVFDPVLVWLGALAVIAFPWNVSLWYVARRLRASIEMDCDRRVLTTNSDAHAYGSLLLDVGSKASSRPFFAAALSESASQLHRRIRAMASFSQPVSRVKPVMSALIAIVVLSAAYAAPRPQSPIIRGGLTQGVSATQNIAMVSVLSGQSTVKILVFATGRARVSLGELPSGATPDTLRLKTPTSFMADVTSGDVHIVSADGSQVDVTAIFRDSPAIKAESHFAHSVLKQGGIGVTQISRNSTAGGPAYFEFQVDKPVVQVPASGGPQYPTALRAANAQGEVQAQFVVDADGNPELDTFKILRATNELFAAAVRSAFPSMRFGAAEIDGKKVRQVVQQAFLFKLGK